MPTSRADTRVICPFYKYDENSDKSKTYRVTCEGIVEKSTLIFSFRRKRDFQIQLETFCCEHYDRCEIYRMLMQKYEEDNI